MAETTEIAPAPQDNTDVLDQGHPEARRPRRWTSLLVEAIAPVAVLVGFFVGWQLIVELTNQPEYLVPTPTVVFDTAYSQAGSILLPAAWVTIQEIIGGFLLAVAVGLPLATIISHSKIASRALNPLIIASQTIPVIAIAPIFVIWFGFGATPKILIAALIAFFPVTINAAAGQQSVDRDALDLMRSLSASKIETFRRLTFPASLPHTFVGLKQAAVVAVIGAVVGEWAGATDGLGPVILSANAGFQTATIFAAIIYLSVIGIGLYLLIALAERLTIPWTRFTTGHSGH